MKRRHNDRAFSVKSRNSLSKASSSRSHSRKPRALRFESLEQRELLAVGPQLIGINPNNGEVLAAGAIRHVAPQELTFRFDENQVIDPATLGGIQIVRSGFDNVIGNANDVAIIPGYVGIGERPNEVVFRFSGDLPDDRYCITVVGAGPNALRNVVGEPFNGGVNRTLNFELDLGAQIIAVVPQPVSRGAGNVLTQARNQIDVYFNNDDLHTSAVQTGQLPVDPTVVDPRFYQLILTSDTVTNTDDQIFYPTSISYDPATDKAVLTFASDLSSLSTGTYRLRIGSDTTLPLVPTTLTFGSSEDPGSSLATAKPLGVLGSQSLIVQSAIEPTNFPLEFPGANDEPGHRQVPVQDHLLAGADGAAGVETFYYNFKSNYGVDPLGNQLFNVITPAQKDLARRIFEMYHAYLGVQFVESDDIVVGQRNLTIVTGDMRAIDPGVATGPGGLVSLSDPIRGMAIMDNAEVWSDTFGGDWFQAAFPAIGLLLNCGFTYEQPVLTVMGSDLSLGGLGEPVFPGDVDIIHGQYLHRPEGNDIDLYTFELTVPGLFTAETIAERLTNSSLLDTVISLYRKVGDKLELIARNDDYFSEDSYLEMSLTQGHYAIGVSASGNREFDVSVEDTGLYGTSDGAYQLRLNLRPTTPRVIVDATGTALDGDSDGVAGGEYNFWFRVQTPARTKFVDKSAVGGVTADGSLLKPYRTISEAFAAAQYGDVVRLVSNGGSDGDVTTLGNNLPFKVGFDELGKALEDGATVKVPRGVTLMIDSGVIFKSQRGAIEVGSTAAGIDRSGGALQVLGTPVMPVYFTSYNDELIGRDTNPSVPQTPTAGDWGGILFRSDLDRASPSRVDYEARGIFLNYVNHADMRYGGGRVIIDSRDQVVSPISMIVTRATVTHNTITRSADAALSATPNTFEETTFHAPQFQTVAFTSDYSRIGPDIHGNNLFNNAINGLFIRIRTVPGEALRPMTVSGRFDDTDVVHVLAENLVVQGTPGGPKYDAKTGQLRARLDASLRIDPGTVVKLSQALIQIDIGAQMIAEGVDGRDVIFTSLWDDTYGAGGNFDTSGDGATTVPAPGDWGGLYFGHVSTGSVDYARIRYGGGIAKLGSSFTGFNPVEIHQADVRLAHSVLEYNAQGMGGQAPSDRFGLFSHAGGTIFVRGAQPIIAENIIRHNAGPAININVNSLNDDLVGDFGRSTGAAGILSSYGDNFGPLVRGNRLLDNGLNGMLVRGDILTTKSIWDDTSIVHVLFNEIIVPDFHTEGGLLLKSSPKESLVVKLSGNLSAGFTAAGRQLDIDDRIGGTLQIIGQPGAPVVLTALADDTVGAGVTPDNTPSVDTNNDGNASAPAAGAWRSIRFAEYCNDRNVALYIEREPGNLVAPGSNGDPDTAEYLGALAPHEKAGDDNLRLGFEVMGRLSKPADVDVYSFLASAGTEIWFDVDGTSQALDLVLELVDRNGVVIARSDNSLDEADNPSLLYGAALVMQKLPPFGGRDFYAVNPKDPGMRVVLPDSAGTNNLYHIRVRSRGSDIEQLDGGLTSGVYRLQIRLRETDEAPGSTVRFADVRYATNGIEIFGQPTHSPLLGEATEDTSPNDTFADAQDVGNMLVSDRAALAIAGLLTLGDIDFYRFDVVYNALLDPNGDWPAGYVAYAGTIFDLDYADGMARGNITLSVFDATGRLVLVAGDSDLREDRPVGQDNDVDDLSRGSAGPLDAFIGTVDLPQGTYYVAVSAVSQMARQIEQYTQRNAVNPLLRLEPVDSVVRIAEDHIGYSGGSTAAPPIVPILIDQSRVVPYALNDIVLFVSQVEAADDTSRLLAVNPFTGVIEVVHSTYGRDVGDIALRFGSEFAGNLFAFTLDLDDNNPSDAESGNFIEINTGTGAFTLIGDDGITTYEWDTGTPPNPVTRSPDGVGIQFEAMTFGMIGGQLRLLGIGYRDGADMDEMPPDGPRPARGVSIVRNILYRFNPTTGAVLDDPNQPRAAGAATDAVERGEILTQPTIIAAAGSAIADGTTFTIDDGYGITAFEFDTGPGAAVNFNFNQGQRITDGEFFSLTTPDPVTGAPTQQIIEFDTGRVLVVNGTSFTDRSTLSIQDDQGRWAKFEFILGTGAPTGTNIAVPYTAATNVGQMVANLVAAINAVPNFSAVATSVSNRISVANDLTISLGPTMTDVSYEGEYGVQGGAIPIFVEESFTPQEVRDAVAQQVTAANIRESFPGVLTTTTATIVATTRGNNVYFSGAASADFTGVNDFTALPNVAGGTRNPDAVPVPFLVTDTAIDIALRIENAINTALPTTVLAGANGASVSLLGLVGAPIVTASAPLVASGAGPGGRITGMTILNGQVYAVSDRGGLWRIDNPLSTAPRAVYIQTSAADLVGINFAGLTAGPSNCENGLYANTLFGISQQGTLYAFGTDGVLQPVFVDAQTSVQLFTDPAVAYPPNFSLNAIQGLAFSSLDTNMWHMTGNRRRGDAGHGIASTVTHARASQQGGTSFYFGRERAGDYDTPGGAHGSIISNAFDLSAYSATDLPTLYFNYFISTEEANGVTAQNPMRDSFRVYISNGNTGQWQLLTTNNSIKGPSTFDEYDEGIGVTVQEIFDYANPSQGTWRQARVSLAAYAGQSDLRLRFEFHTAGSVDLGDIYTAGSELRAVPGAKLRDGDTFVIDNDPAIIGDDITFEFDLGYTVVLPSGGAIADGDTVTVVGPNGSAVFEFDNDMTVHMTLWAPDAAAFADEQTFSVSDGTRTVTFEFDDVAGAPSVQPGNVAIDFDPLGGADGAQMVATIMQAIIGAGPWQTDPGLTLDVGTSPLQLVANTPISFTATDTPAGLGSRLAAAIAAANLGVIPHINTLDGGRVNLEYATLVSDTSAGIGVEGQPGAQVGVRVKVHEAMTTREVADAIRTVVAGVFAGFNSQIIMPDGSSLIEGQTITITLDTQVLVVEFDSGYVLDLPLTGVSDGDTVTVDDAATGTTTVFEFDSGFSLFVPVGGGNPAGGVQHDDRIVINDQQPGSIDVVFRFAKDGSDLDGIVDIPITDLTTQGEIGALLVQAIGSSNLGLTPVYLGNGQVHLGGTTHRLSTPSSITQTGQPSVQTPGALAVPFSPAMSPRLIGTALAGTIATAGIRLDTAQYMGSNRVYLGGTVDHTVTASASMIVSGQPGAQTPGAVAMPFMPGTVFTADQAALALASAINNAAMGIQATAAGRRVNLMGGDIIVSAGGATNLTINAAPTHIVKQFDDVLRIIGHTVTNRGKLLLSNFEFGDLFGAYNSPLRAQANDFEGVYIDDLIIGFAERGEMASNATVDTAFRANPETPANQILQGAYQLEIRRASEYGNPILPSGDQWFLPTSSIDTNDRLAETITLLAPSGDNIFNGQSFVLGDGLDVVMFVFQDINARPADPGDVMSAAVNTGLVPSGVGTFSASGAIDDPLDVDFYAVDLNEGDFLTIDIDAQSLGSSLDSFVRLFNAAGVPVAMNDDDPAPGEVSSDDSYLEFTALTAGRYYIGVSGFDNSDYNPNLADSGTPSLSLGTYRIEIHLNGGAETAPVVVIPYQSNQTAAQVARLMVTAINSPAVQALLDLRANAHSNSNRVDLSGSVTIGAGIAAFVSEPNDTIAEAIETGVAPGRAGVYRTRGDIGGGTSTTGSLDVDMFRFELAAGETVSIDIDAWSLNSPLDSVLRLFDATGVPLAISDNNAAPGETWSLDSYLSFTAATAGVYYVGVSGYDNFSYDSRVAGSGSATIGSTGFYEITITRSTAAYSDIGSLIRYDFGDQNRFRDQGQLLIESNFITNSLNYGIVSDAGQRSTPDGSPHQGPARVLWKVNDNGLVPGTTIANNVIAFSGQGGIHFSGDTTPANGQPAPMPYGRILNNTIYGNTTANTTIGIKIDNNASPTVLNNILANLGTGIDIDATSRTSVLGGLLFQNNSVMNSTAGLGNHAIVLLAGDPLFVNPAGGNFYLDRDSKAIDSAVKSLEDRNLLIQIREPLGIANAPVIAPDVDVFGLLRADDPSVKTPAGLGETVFIDRGAIDRIDFGGPLAALAIPADGDGDTFAQTNEALRQFIIQLDDVGAGVDDATVDGGKLVFSRDGVLLVQGVDYTFRYDSTNNQIRLTAGTGVFLPGDYHIQLDNSAATGIRDLANNLLQANRMTGTVEFNIEFGLGIDWGDAPDPSYPTLRPTGASHAIVEGFYLGYGVDPDNDGEPSALADADAFDDGVIFVTPVRAVGQSQISVRASAAGFLDAWIDYNRNGLWDANEQVFASRALTQGDNLLTFSTPAGVTPSSGESFARFRFSSTGGLAVTGAAIDGEVEDYRITLVSAGWQNPINPLDVSGNGVVSAQDALLLANFLYFNGTCPVPTGPGTAPFPVQPPPYYDVNGDNFVSHADVFLVISYLRGLTPPPNQAAPPMAMAAPPAPPAEIPATLAAEVVAAPTVFVAAACTPTPAVDSSAAIDPAVFAEALAGYGSSPVDLGLTASESSPREEVRGDVWASSADELLAPSAADYESARAEDDTALFETDWVDADVESDREAVFAAFAEFGDRDEWGQPLTVKLGDEEF